MCSSDLNWRANSTAEEDLQPALERREFDARSGKAARRRSRGVGGKLTSIGGEGKRVLEWRSQAIAASKQRKERTVSEKETLCSERIDLLLERGVLVAEPIDGGAGIERTDEAARKRRDEDKGDRGRGDEGDAVAKVLRRDECAKSHGTSLPSRGAKVKQGRRSRCRLPPCISTDRKSTRLNSSH